MEEANIWALVNQMREENQMQAEKGDCRPVWRFMESGFRGKDMLLHAAKLMVRHI